MEPAMEAAWLARLVLLYGIPPHYLIPEQRMLPEESIRFFFVDPVWIQCVVQGACSVGNTSGADRLVDQAMNTWLLPTQPPNGNGAPPSPVAQLAAGVRDRLRNEREGVELPKTSGELQWPLTGFLLRSSTVAGWRGLEVMAYADRDKKAPLKPLRIEQLSQDIMLGLFNGKIVQLVIRQPQEGLHFGVTPKGSSYTKTLREFGYTNKSAAGQTLGGAPIELSTDNLLRDQPQRGVIDIAALAARMKAELAQRGQLEHGKFTSAEFGVQMIEAAGEFTFEAQGT
jgi:hypothetical protein